MNISGGGSPTGALGNKAISTYLKKEIKNNKSNK
jgi:hypothetical protein